MQNRVRNHAQDGSISILYVAVPMPKHQTGGADKAVLETLAEIRNHREFSPAVLAFREGEFAEKVRSMGVPIRVVEGARDRLIGASTLTRMLQTILSQSSQCIVHTQGYYSNFVAYLALAMRPSLRRRVRWVNTCHGWLRPNLLWRLLTQLDIIVCAQADLVLSVSRRMSDTLYSRGMPRERVKALEYWPRRLRHVSETEREALRMRFGAGEGAQLAGYVGRLSPEKRPDLFIKACAHVKRVLPNARFIVVGGGDDRPYRDLAAKYGLASEIQFCGYQEDMAEVFAVLDALVVTSDSEGMPNVILEAWSTGVPVITRSVGGIPEFTRDRFDVIQVHSSAPEDIAHSIIEVLSSRAVTNSLIANGRARVKADFGASKSIQHICDSYRALLQRTADESIAHD